MTATPSSSLDAPGLAHFAHLTVLVAAPIEVGDVGHGQRRIIPIRGGSCVTKEWTARVLEAGADFQLIVSPTCARLEARYVLETNAGDRIFVQNDAVRSAAPDVMAQLIRGVAVDPGLVYFRCVPRFEVSSPALAWMRDRLFVGTGLRRPEQVEMSFFEVL